MSIAMACFGFLFLDIGILIVIKMSREIYREGVYIYNLYIKMRNFGNNT